MLTKTKRILGLFLALVMMFSVPVMAENITITTTYDLVLIRVNGSYINAPSYLYGNYVYVPLRAVSEAMGAEVLWNGETQTITITTNKAEPKSEPKAFTINKGEDLSFDAYINYVKVTINGQEQMIPHFLYNGTTYVPVSVFYDYFGCHVLQHLATSSVRIYEPDYKTFKDNEVFYVDDTAFTKTETTDLSKTFFNTPNPATVVDYANIEDYLLTETAMKKLGKMMVSDEGFSEYYSTTDYDNLMTLYGVQNKESFIENVAWPMYYSESFTDKLLENYFDPTDADLEAFLPKSTYGQSRWLKAKHILINKTEDGSGLKQAEEVLSFVKENPEKFDSMMATYSQDPGSIAQPDGYLFKEGDMVTEFYEGTLPLQVGEISGIVESAFGYHIILKVADYENGVPFAEAKEEIKYEYINDSFNNLYVNLMAETDTVFNRTVIEEK